MVTHFPENRKFHQGAATESPFTVILGSNYNLDIAGRHVRQLFPSNERPQDPRQLYTRPRKPDGALGDFDLEMAR